MRGTVPAAQWRERDSFGADSSKDRHVISAEDWRAWEEKTRVRGKARIKKVTGMASGALLFLWLIGVAMGFPLRGFICIVPALAVVALIAHVVQQRRSIR